MTGPSFARVRRLCAPLSAATVHLYATTVVSVVAFLALLLSLGCVAHRVLTPDAPDAGVLTPLVQASWAELSGPYDLWLWLGTALASGGVYFLARYLLDRAAVRNALLVSARLRHDLHRNTFHLAGADVLGRAETNPVQLFTEESEQVRRGLVAWWNAVPRALLLFVLLVSLAVSLHVWLSLAAILLGVLLLMLGTWMAAAADHRRVLLADRASVQMSTLVEGLKHARLVSGYLLEDTPGAPLDETMPRYLKHARELHLHGLGWRPLLSFCVLAAALLLVGLTGVNVLSQPPRIISAEAVLLGLALASAVGPLVQLIRLNDVVIQADRSAEAILDYLNREPRVKEFPDAQQLAGLSQQLQLEDVRLHDADGQVLLENVSLTVPARRRVAIVCTDSAAALSLACLFPRFYDPDAGRVLYDGRDVRNATLKSLRGQIGMVLQEGLVFTASVLENIACGDYRYSETEVREAAKIVGADEFILRLPQGFATTIGENGIRLSPSEGLLVGLCRAMVRNPSILIVEEPGEQLDPEMALRVNHALGVTSQERTMLILATRLETLRTADHVCLLHEGRLQAEGTHAELLQGNELYRHLIYLRFNSFRNPAAPQTELIQSGQPAPRDVASSPGA